MKYHTINELDHFCFKEAYIAQICAVSGMFEIVFDNVTILPANSCNRWRKAIKSMMRTAI